MHVEHHPLATEFPEFKQTIHDLKLSDRHFAKLFEEYEVVDKAIVRIEDGLEHVDDLILNDMKKQRLLLKDELYHILKSTVA
jgi:uncharacterized protein